MVNLKTHFETMKQQRSTHTQILVILDGWCHFISFHVISSAILACFVLSDCQVSAIHDSDRHYRPSWIFWDQHNGDAESLRSPKHPAVIHSRLQSSAFNVNLKVHDPHWNTCWNSTDPSRTWRLWQRTWMQVMLNVDHCIFMVLSWYRAIISC